MYNLWLSNERTHPGAHRTHHLEHVKVSKHLSEIQNYSWALKYSNGIGKVLKFNLKLFFKVFEYLFYLKNAQIRGCSSLELEPRQGIGRERFGKLSVFDCVINERALTLMDMN